jgi:hypothetical protein
MMRVWTLGVVAAAALGIAGCEDRRGVDRGDARGEQGRDLGSSADRAGEDLREGANDTKRELRETGREAQGKDGLDDKVKDKAEDAKD